MKYAEVLTAPAAIDLLGADQSPVRCMIYNSIPWFRQKRLKFPPESCWCLAEATDWNIRGRMRRDLRDFTGLLRATAEATAGPGETWSRVSKQRGIRNMMTTRTPQASEVRAVS